MAFNDNAEHVRILSSVRKGIEGLRRRMQELQPELSISESEAVNVARQELCGSLVRRLVIAEKEIQELQDMLELNQKAWGRSDAELSPARATFNGLIGADWSDRTLGSFPKPFLRDWPKRQPSVCAVRQEEPAGSGQRALL